MRNARAVRAKLLFCFFSLNIQICSVFVHVVVVVALGTCCFGEDDEEMHQNDKWESSACKTIGFSHAD